MGNSNGSGGGRSSSGISRVSHVNTHGSNHNGPASANLSASHNVNVGNTGLNVSHSHTVSSGSKPNHSGSATIGHSVNLDKNTSIGASHTRNFNGGGTTNIKVCRTHSTMHGANMTTNIGATTNGKDNHGVAAVIKIDM